MQELYLSKKQLPFVIVIDKIESKPKKGKTCVFKTFVNKCHENWKKNPKTTYSLSYHLQNKKKSNLKISSKSIRTDRKLIKLIRKLIKTDQKLMSSQSLFCLFSSLRKIMHFYKSFLWSQKIILESWKRTRWSPLNN